MPLVGRIATKLSRWEDRRDFHRSAEFGRRLAALAEATTGRRPDPRRPSLAELVRLAWTTGEQIDLAGVGYGPAHWDGGERFVPTPNPYYHFLAGLVRVSGSRRIFEIGSHYGGSILAMRRGIDDPGAARLLTTDITDLNPALHSLPGLKKLVADANKQATIQEVTAFFAGEPVDLIYVDADHRFLPTMTNLGIYTLLLQPKLVVIDDIVLNDGMAALWDALRAAFGGAAVNCADIVPEIRSPTCGFGLLRLR